ncbi:MAG: hydroxymethylbilane synthase, partial [Gammaproteobacteria bacterium]
MNPKPLRIATRKSALALWQAGHVAACLEALAPGRSVELVPLTTQGDRNLQDSLALAGGKGLFVKELETALAEDRAELAVHSMKDVPVALPAEFVIAAVLEREDPRDAFVSVRWPAFEALPAGAKVGSSSLRRQCQLLHQRPDLKLLPLRGNVDTRLKKLEAGEYDAVILAVAGLKRLALANKITAVLDVRVSLPAIAQGTIGVECR